MKYRYLPLFIIAAVLGSAAKTRADVAFSFSVGAEGGHERHDGDRHEWQHPRYVPAYYYPYYGHRYYRPYAVAPVVVPQPVYVTPPAPAAVVPLTGDYGNDLAQLNQKLSRLRAILQRQNQNGTLSQDNYNRFMDTLDGIEHDEHARAYDSGGNLSADDFADLYRRANQAGDDIEIALGQ